MEQHLWTINLWFNIEQWRWMSCEGNERCPLPYDCCDEELTNVSPNLEFEKKKIPNVLNRKSRMQDYRQIWPVSIFDLVQWTRFVWSSHSWSQAVSHRSKRFAATLNFICTDLDQVIHLLRTNFGLIVISDWAHVVTLINCNWCSLSVLITNLLSIKTHSEIINVFTRLSIIEIIKIAASNHNNTHSKFWIESPPLSAPKTILIRSYVFASHSLDSIRWGLWARATTSRST